MARPIKYFPLDTRVFSDMKFELLVSEFGLEATAIAIKLLCEITRRRKRNTIEHPEYLLVEIPGKPDNVSTRTELKPEIVDKNEIPANKKPEIVDEFSQRKGK